VSDRFPLLLAALLVCVAVVAGFGFSSAERGEFADRLSTYRASKHGARALYQLLSENRLRVERLEQRLDIATGSTNFALLGIGTLKATTTTDAGVVRQSGGLFQKDDDETEDDELTDKDGLNALKASQLNEDEIETLLKRVESGSRLLFVPLAASDNELTSALQLTLRKPAPNLGIRTLVPAQPSPYARGVERIESRVVAFLDLPQTARPLLIDEMKNEVVAAVIPYGQGEVVFVAAPELADNDALARADNAMFWLSMGAALSYDKALAFDEFHHGFTGERSIGSFARRYGLQYALAQLIFGLVCWAFSLKVFGRATTPQLDLRREGTDALLSTSRLYLEGKHLQHAADVLVIGTVGAVASRFSFSSQSSATQTAEMLRLAGETQAAATLDRLVAAAKRVRTEDELLTVAREASALRRLSHADSHHFMTKEKVSQ
jgi:hypothetical protein